MKRICLFAAYDPDHIIDDYVIHYLKELSQYADIYYLADCEMDHDELRKIAPFTISASAYKHGKYDFGAWAELIKTIGWDEIENYDELILVNDSQYLVGDIGNFLTSMEKRHLDFWAGLAVCEEYRGGRIPLEQFISSRNILEIPFTFVSSFLVLSKNLFNKPFIKNFFSEIKPVSNRLEVYEKYELGLSRLILRHKINFGTYIEDLFSQSSIYKNSAFYFLTLGYPFIKIKLFHSKYYPVIAPLNRFRFIKYFNPNFDKNIIIDHQNRVDPFKNHKKLTSQVKDKSNFDKVFRGISKIVYELSPKFLTKYFKKLIDLYDTHLFESKFFGSKLAYFSRFLFSIPEQKMLAKRINNKKRLIIHFIDARDIISGGMLSINRLIEKSKSVEVISDYELVLSGLPLYNPPVKFTYFQEVIPQIKFSWIVKYCHPDEVIIHLPEVLSQTFYENLSENEKAWLVKIPKLQINIMNQNIELMPERDVIRNQLGEITENITITTAHSTYATQQLSNKYSAPVHQLTPFLPDFFNINFAQKEKVILISNDNSLYGSTIITKDDIIGKLKNDLPTFKIVEINKLPLEDYKNLIAHSLFTISFGEGFDGYFIEPLLSNSLSFAVFNPFYFPSEFKDSELIYESWDALYDNIVDDIKIYAGNPQLYEKSSAKNRELVNKYISNKKSMAELENFYKERYDFLPKPVDFELLIEYKQKLESTGKFKFFGGPSGDEMVLTPDQNVLINMKGDFYKVIDEIYNQNIYDIDIAEDFIMIDIGFHAGVVSLYMMKKHENLKRVFGFEAMLPTYIDAEKNIKNNGMENKIILRPLALSDQFYFRKIPFIPDWSASMSIDTQNISYEMFSSSEMKDEIRYIETEIVPAWSELKEIIENTPHKIVLKCNAPGSELKIINNLSERGLLRNIHTFIIRTFNVSNQPIIDLLDKNEFKIKDLVIDKKNDKHQILAEMKQN